MLVEATSFRSRARRALLRLPLRGVFSAVRKVWTPPPALQRHLYFSGPFRVPVEGRSFVMINDGLEVETDIFWNGVGRRWEKRSLAAWIRLCRDASVILDVGANTGVYALVAQTVNPGARVHAFEPVTRVFDKLQANVAANGYAIACHQTALSNYSGTGVIYDLPVDHIYTVTVNRNTFPADWPVRETTVVTSTLRNFLETQQIRRVDLIKLDVESHEPEVLEGMGPYLREMRPTLLVEVWNDEVGQRVEALVDGLGYRFFETDEKRPFTPATHIRHPEGPARGYRTYLVGPPSVASTLAASGAMA